MLDVAPLLLKLVRESGASGRRGGACPLPSGSPQGAPLRFCVETLNTLTAPGSKTWTYSYNDLGQLVQYYHPNGMNTYYSFDGRNRMTKISHNDGMSPQDSWTYALDKIGNITKTTNQDSTYWDYAYDARYRLTNGTRKDSGGNALQWYTYTYDDADNIITRQIATAGSPPPTITDVYEHTDANEMTKDTRDGSTVTTFGYDLWGRMNTKAQGFYSATYAYKYDDKLASVTSNFPNEGNVTYGYWTPDGKRRDRNVGGTVTQYNWDAGWNVINEEDTCGNLTMTYVNAGMILADIDASSGAYRYYFQDNIGSTRRLRAQDKSSLGVYEYEPYGLMYSESGATIRYKYTGKEWDSTAQLYYFPFRYYAPSLARWMTRDPIGPAGGSDLYAYVGGNPTNFTDPLGLGPISIGSANDRYIRSLMECETDLTPDLIEGGLQGAMLFADTLDPLGNYFEERGFYSNADPGIRAARWPAGAAAWATWQIALIGPLQWLKPGTRIGIDLPRRLIPGFNIIHVENSASRGIHIGIWSAGYMKAWFHIYPFRPWPWFYPPLW